MPKAETTVPEVIRTLLDRRGGEDVEFTLDADLIDDLLFDSLEIAELSAVLEDSFGSDPYSAGLIPRTAREVVQFYEASL